MMYGDSTAVYLTCWLDLDWFDCLFLVCFVLACLVCLCV